MKRRGSEYRTDGMETGLILETVYTAERCMGWCQLVVVAILESANLKVFLK